MHLTQHRRSWSPMVLMFTILTLWLVAPPAGAQDRVPRFIQFTVQDQDGNFFPIGEVEFCTPDGICLYADIENDFPGHFNILSEKLEPGTAYSVRIYDPQVAVHFEMRNWVFTPLDYDPSFEHLIGVDKFLIYPRFQGDDAGDMVFHIDTTLNPEWSKRQRKSQLDADSDPNHPGLIAGFQFPVMLGGKFTTDGSAIGGVDDVRVGIGLSGRFRFGYPKKTPPRDHWISFKEITLAYQQNRYETLEIMTPGRRSDVTFHRMKLSFGMGKMNQSYSSHWSVGLTAAAAGLYDGTASLKYLERTYTRSGIGFQASWLQGVLKIGRVNVGASVQVEMIYYFADNISNDYWFGMAPSASFGMVVF